MNQVNKKEREQQKVLAEKVATLSDSDIAEVQTAVEKIVLEEQQPERHSEDNGESEEWEKNSEQSVYFILLNGTKLSGFL